MSMGHCRGGHTEDFIPLADIHPPRAMHHHTSSLTTTEDSDMLLKRLLKKNCRILRQDNNKEMWLIFSDAGDVSARAYFIFVLVELIHFGA